jgi:hypothetical protein
MKKRETLRAVVFEPNPDFPLLSGRREIEVTGNRYIEALVEAGDRGTTALEMSSWALRLSRYIFNLRTRYGLDIETRDEPHDGGTHGRYFLLSQVEIIDTEAESRAA